MLIDKLVNCVIVAPLLWITYNWLREFPHHHLIPSSTLLYVFIWQCCTLLLCLGFVAEKQVPLRRQDAVPSMHPPPLLPVERIISCWCRGGYNLLSRTPAWCHSVTAMKAKNVTYYLLSNISRCCSWQPWPYFKNILKICLEMKCQIFTFSHLCVISPFFVVLCWASANKADRHETWEQAGLPFFESHALLSNIFFYLETKVLQHIMTKSTFLCTPTDRTRQLLLWLMSWPKWKLFFTSFVFSKSGWYILIMYWISNIYYDRKRTFCTYETCWESTCSSFLM